MDLKELLHNFFDRQVAGPLHDELYSLRQDVDRLMGRDLTPVQEPISVPTVIVEPVPVEVPTVEPTEPEIPSDQEVQETEAHS